MRVGEAVETTEPHTPLVGKLLGTTAHRSQKLKQSSSAPRYENIRTQVDRSCAKPRGKMEPAIAE